MEFNKFIGSPPCEHLETDSKICNLKSGYNAAYFCFAPIDCPYYNPNKMTFTCPFDVTQLDPDKVYTLYIKNDHGKWNISGMEEAE